MKNLLLIATIAVLAACDSGPKSAAGFRLPDGNAAAGRQAFVMQGCLNCHIVDGLETSMSRSEAEMDIKIGGMRAETQTYGRLVTSIINPSHTIAQPRNVDAREEDGSSKMRNYNDILTVQELIDLVAFLQPYYAEMPDY